MERIMSAVVCVVGLGLAAASCRHDEPASVMVAITSEAPVPEGIDLVEVSVERGGVETFVNFYGAGSTLRLPGTLAIDKAPGEDVDEPISIRVVASLRGEVRVERRATVLFVAGEQRVLRMPLRFACLGVSCDAGSTCRAGTCLPERVDLAQELAYDEGRVFGDKNPVGCFRRDACGERVTLSAAELGALFDPGACTLQATTPGEAREDLNVGLAWRDDPRKASTVVDLDAVEGWYFDEAYASTGKVHLVRGLCEAVKAGKIGGGERVLGCAPKLPTQPLCPYEDGAAR